jgi:AAA domain
MPTPVVEILADDRANVYFDGRLWKRIQKNDSRVWCRILLRKGDKNVIDLISPKQAKLLETIYQEQLKHPKRIHRCPRLAIPETIKTFHEVPLLSQIEGGSDPWLVDGLIREGSTNLLSGAPGDFKTWLALELAGAVSKGTDFLGRKTIQTRVLYLDRENPCL